MKKRYRYALLFALPGFFLALLFSFFLFASAAGLLWLYVWGDQPWPSQGGTVLPALLPVTFLISWLASIIAGFLIGKRLEGTEGLEKSHLLAAAGTTVASIAVITLHQFSVGNLGAKSDGILCSDYCLHNGYYASGMPQRNSGNRTCSCYDDAGTEALTLHIDAIQSAETRFTE